MKKIKNLTENKDLINTFKRFKIRQYLNKTSLKKNFFYTSKFKSNFYLRFFFKHRNTLIFLKSRKIDFYRKHNLSFFKVILMFNNLYVYSKS